MQPQLSSSAGAVFERYRQPEQKRATYRPPAYSEKSAREVFLCYVCTSIGSTCGDPTSRTSRGRCPSVADFVTARPDVRLTSDSGLQPVRAPGPLSANRQPPLEINAH